MHILSKRFVNAEERGLSGYVIDTVLAIMGALLATGFIYVFHLYPKIPNISFLSLLVVLALAITRGRYAAILASVISLLTFDYFLVPPIYLFTISNQDEWFALFIFLLTAVITGQLASAYKTRAELAHQRENETRALYDLLRATATATNLERQLGVVARALVDNFSFAGVRDCMILLLDETGKLQLCADSVQTVGKLSTISVDEEKTAATVLAQGTIIDLHHHTSSSNTLVPHWFRRSVTNDGAEYVRLIPLQLGTRTVGVLRLLMENTNDTLSLDHHPGSDHHHLNPRSAFFWTFLDQAAVIIERARLRREAVEIELLRRTDSLRSALLSSVSHDLRTPLSSIKAAASSLLQDDVEWTEDERRSFALAIERESDRLNRLVGNLLDMSRIEGGALKSEKEWYPLEEVIHDVLGHMQFLLQDREVITRIPEDLPPVPLDYLQIDQVLTNVIENALRYTPTPSPIEISATVREHMMLVQIADSGPGIPPDDLERIFDKFYRVTRPNTGKSSARGSGLGLAVCRGLIEAHGGHIWAENRSGGGAIFQLTLPLAEEEQ